MRVGRKRSIRCCSVASIVASSGSAVGVGGDSEGGAITDMTGASTGGGSGAACGWLALASMNNVESEEALERRVGERVAVD